VGRDESSLSGLWEEFFEVDRDEGRGSVRRKRWDLVGIREPKISHRIKKLYLSLNQLTSSLPFLSIVIPPLYFSDNLKCKSISLQTSLHSENVLDARDFSTKCRPSQ
jgi:hypothetical protein